jgi:DNA repair photolyase
MGLRKQKGNMYGFVDRTWNTIKGKCPHDCKYCYMKKWGQQPELHFDEKELRTKLGENHFIFVGSSCDMFANNISEEWINKTIEHCNKYPTNKYLFQSKDPSGFLNFAYEMDDKFILATTIETNRKTYINKYSGGSSFKDRIEGIRCCSVLYKTMITIEPIMDFDIFVMIEKIKEVSPFQVNIGADSGYNNLPEPSKEKILELILELEKFTTVFRKSNLGRLLK